MSEKNASGHAKKSNAGLISIIMASYNYERYLADAVESVTRQGYPHWELLLADDGSTDYSWSMIERFAVRDARIRPLCHPGHANKGLPGTIQLALGQARGEFVAFLESDDMWRPDCLEKRLARIQGTGAGLVFNHVELLAMPGALTDGYKILVDTPLEEYRGEQGSFSPEKALLTRNVVPTFSCAMARTDALLQCDFSSPVPRWLDWWLWLQMARRERFVYLPKALTIWRIHTASYNNKVSLKRYLHDGKAMWEGFRRLYRHESGYTKFGLYLRMPFWTRLCARMLAILRADGLSGLAVRIKRRLRA